MPGSGARPSVTRSIALSQPELSMSYTIPCTHRHCLQDLGQFSALPRLQCVERAKSLPSAPSSFANDRPIWTPTTVETTVFCYHQSLFEFISLLQHRVQRPLHTEPDKLLSLPSWYSKTRLEYAKGESVCGEIGMYIRTVCAGGSCTYCTGGRERCRNSWLGQRFAAVVRR